MRLLFCSLRSPHHILCLLPFEDYQVSPPSSSTVIGSVLGGQYREEGHGESHLVSVKGVLVSQTYQ